jgi:hypothetical protein
MVADKDRRAEAVGLKAKEFCSSEHFVQITVAGWRRRRSRFDLPPIRQMAGA